MELSSLFGKRFDLAIELFQNGEDTLLFEGVLFINKGEFLEVNSYSDFDIDRTTEAMAHEKIERSKQVLASLSQDCPEFNGIVLALPKQYFFCYDYHTAACLVASEVQGEFAWHL